ARDCEAAASGARDAATCQDIAVDRGDLRDAAAESSCVEHGTIATPHEIRALTVELALPCASGVRYAAIVERHGDIRPVRRDGRYLRGMRGKLEGFRSVFVSPHRRFPVVVAGD